MLHQQFFFDGAHTVRAVTVALALRAAAA